MKKIETVVNDAMVDKVGNYPDVANKLPMSGVSHHPPADKVLLPVRR